MSIVMLPVTLIATRIYNLIEQGHKTKAHWTSTEIWERNQTHAASVHNKPNSVPHTRSTPATLQSSSIGTNRELAVPHKHNDWQENAHTPTVLNSITKELKGESTITIVGTYMGYVRLFRVGRAVCSRSRGRELTETSPDHEELHPGTESSTSERHLGIPPPILHHHRHRPPPKGSLCLHSAIFSSLV